MWRDIEDLPQHLDLQNFVFEALNLDRVLRHEDRLRAGWWYTYPSKKYYSVGMMTFPTEWKLIKFHGSKPPKPVITNYH